MPHRHGPQGGCLRYVYLTFTSDQSCEEVNQPYGSFGLADRYLILMWTKCYKVLWDPVTLMAPLTRKPVDHPLGHTGMIIAGLPHCLSPAYLKD